MINREIIRGLLIWMVVQLEGKSLGIFCTRCSVPEWLFWMCSMVRSGDGRNSRLEDVAETEYGGSSAGV